MGGDVPSEREERVSVKAEKEDNKTGCLSVCVIIAHGFPFHQPQDPAPVGHLYSPLLFEGEKAFCSPPPSECKGTACLSIILTIFSSQLCFFCFLTLLKLKDSRS